MKKVYNFKFFKWLLYLLIYLRSNTLTLPTNEMLISIPSAKLGGDRKIIGSDNNGDLTVKSLKRKRFIMCGWNSANIITILAQTN